MDACDRNDFIWRKSSHSGGSQECVEVATMGHGIAVRDSKDPNGSRMVFGRDSWTTFIGGVKLGEFDRP